MTDRNGRISVLTAKLDNKDKRHSIDFDRYTNPETIARPFNRATLGLAPPPPDYFPSPTAPDTYEGIDDYQKSTDNYSSYLQSSELNTNLPRTSTNASAQYAILDPEEAALEREKSRALSTETVYSSLDEANISTDDYMSLQHN